MTDKEILNALECIASKENVFCDSCPYKKYHLLECHRQGAKNALDLINRQQAEIEKLQSMNRDLKVDTCNIEEQLIDVTEKFICQQTVYNDLSNIIKEKNAEIDRLKNENEILSLNADNAFQDGMNEAQDLYAEQVKAEVKSEAIKEYKEKLKEHAYLDSGITGYQAMVVDLSDIENIADEMVGEE